MKNTVCMAVSKIKPSASLEYNKELGPEATHALYRAMAEIVEHSVRTHLEGDFEVIRFEDEVDSYQEIFHRNWHNVYNTWSEGRNILFLDTDTLMIRPTKVFGEFDRFQMFNYTDPKTLCGADANNQYGIQHPHYFNAGVRYYPGDMSDAVWQTGATLAENWDYSVWGTEQIIFNKMQFDQDSDVNTWLNPGMNYQCMNIRYDAVFDERAQEYLAQWNGVSFDKAHILHLHGTRSAVNTVMLQWQLWKDLTGEQFEFSELRVETDTNGNIQNLKVPVKEPVLVL